eukprot:2507316-Rhodomonas_salina.1
MCHTEHTEGGIPSHQERMMKKELTSGARQECPVLYLCEASNRDRVTGRVPTWPQHCGLDCAEGGQICPYA